MIRELCKKDLTEDYLKLLTQLSGTFDENKDEGDTEVVKRGVRLIVDPMSIQYLMGAEIDFQEDLQGARFVIKNPNATTTCSCGSSFS